MSDGNEALYQEFPPQTVGGIKGDYFVICPIPDCRWAEYRLIVASTSDAAGQYSAVVSGSRLIADNVFPYTNAQSYNNDSAVDAIPMRFNNSSTQIFFGDWVRITNSEKKVFVHIYSLPGAGVMYVTIQMRARRLTIIPGPSHEVHPDHMHKLNQARSEKTVDRLREMGVPGYAEEGTGVNTNKGF